MSRQPRIDSALCTLLVIAGSVCLGCAGQLTMPRPTPPAFERIEPHVLAGVAEADITPPVGLGMFGHGPESRVAVGTELRLRCQSFVILGTAHDQQPGEAVALVSCDLGAPSLLLQREIAKRVAARNVPLGAERILLMATHTHLGPAHYF